MNRPSNYPEDGVPQGVWVKYPELEAWANESPVIECAAASLIDMLGLAISGGSDHESVFLGCASMHLVDAAAFSKVFASQPAKGCFDTMQAAALVTFEAAGRGWLPTKVADQRRPDRPFRRMYPRCSRGRDNSQSLTAWDLCRCAGDKLR